jgi:allophanate hydrolase
MPLHAQLVAMGASFRASTRTAPVYRLYALAGTSPAKPGLVRTNDGGGSIEVELYDLSPTSFGLLTASVASPLAIGTVLLDGGESCHGFICEAAAAEQALDITEFGGWRRFVASNRA